MFQFFWVRTASIGPAVCYILFGFLLLLFPDLSGTLFVWLLAAGAALWGILHLGRYLRGRKANESLPGELFLTVLALAFALFALLWPESILAFLPLVLGAFLLIDGLGKLPLAIDGLRRRYAARVPLALSSFLPLALGLLLLLRPLETAKLVIRVFGIALLLDGASDLATCLAARRG